MSITVKKTGKRHRICIKGEMTIYTATELWVPLSEAVSKAKSIVVDLSGVIEIDSAGVQLLMLIKQIAMDTDKELMLVEHSESVVDVFEELNLIGYFGDPVLLSGKGV
jgi:anti-sigma B factor antagonist